MNNRKMDPIEAEVDAIRQKIWARIKDMTFDEKRAYYRAHEERLFREFNIRVSDIKPAGPHRHEISLSPAVY